MKIRPSDIADVKIIEQFMHTDHRGVFIKNFHADLFAEAGIDFHLKESFYSINHNNVIRGMHYHKAPFDHAKIVFCSAGAFLDVALDIREDSPTFGQYIQQELTAENGLAMYIPKGFAHGFASLQNNTIVNYFVDGMYHAESDAGVLYNSFGMDWNINEPILNERDLAFKPLIKK
jgi:dTDP-4-dehydrorhamnose 3,5-epimerase